MSATRASLAELRRPLMLLALGFGAGLVPRVPGTAGTAAGLLLYVVSQPLPFPFRLALTVALVVVGIPICARAARRLEVHDDSAIVWDEIAGIWIALLALPAEPVWLAAGFVLFRVFDMAKPGPIRWIDRRIEGGIGIIADDVFAGVAACAVLQLVRLALAV